MRVDSQQSAVSFDEARRRLYYAHVPCCELGQQVPCVCRISVRCPVHGSHCVGTHD